MPIVFDQLLWHERAERRWNNAVRRGIDEEVANAMFQTDCKAIVALEKVIAWATSKNVNVLFVKQFSSHIYDLDGKKVIAVSGRIRPMIQVHLILHEAGHHLIGDRKSSERFGKGYSSQDPSVKKSFHHKCDVLEEEFEAWHRGWRLAQRLGLKIKKSEFDATKIAQIRTYMCWALNVPGYRDSDHKDNA